MRHRTTSDNGIVSDPQIMMGKPTVRGTRITVELILEKLAAGETEAQLLIAHPHLTLNGIRAAVAFAADAHQSNIRWVPPIGREAETER